MHRRCNTHGIALSMMARLIKTVTVSRGEWSHYWNRAQELLASMRSNIDEARWNAAVVDAVHSVISANDTFTIQRMGVRCGSEDRSDATDLFEQALHADDDGNPAARLGRILAIKSHVEYGPSRVSEEQARRVAKDVERFFLWVQSKVERHR